MKPVRLLTLGPVDWLLTQSVYHALAESMTADTPDTIVLTRPRQAYLCVGFHQSYYAVLDHDACARHGLPVVRRRVGGGTTLLDANQQFYQCIFHHTRVPAKVTDVYSLLLSAPVAVLRQLGLNAALRDANEIEVDGRRAAGIGGGRIGEAIVVVGNLLLDFDYELMTRVWHAPTDIFRQLAGDALRERLTTLRDYAPFPPDDMQTLLADAYAQALQRPVIPGSLTAAEREKIAEVEERLLSEEWLALHSEDRQPMAALKISRGVFIHEQKASMDGYDLRATLRVRDDVIEQAVLESNPPAQWDAAHKTLNGVALKDWTGALAASLQKVAS